MIVDRVYEYLGGTKTAPDPALLDVAVAAFRRTLTRNFTGEREEERRHVSPSSSWYCGRRMLYSAAGAAREAQSPRSAITFAWGDTAEAMGVFLARLAGVPLLSPAADGTQQRVVVRVGGEDLPGNIDASVDHLGVEIPVDFKSMSDQGYGELEAAIRDPGAKWWTEHKWDIVTQVRLYMLGLEQKHRVQVNAGIVVGVNKNTGHLAELWVPRDQQHLALLDRMLPRLRQHQAQGTQPDRPAWASSVVKPGANLRADGSKGSVEELTHWRCGYCPFVGACWPGFERVLMAKPAWRRAV